MFSRFFALIALVSLPFISVAAPVDSYLNDMTISLEAKQLHRNTRLKAFVCNKESVYGLKKSYKSSDAELRSYEKQCIELAAGDTASRREIIFLVSDIYRKGLVQFKTSPNDLILWISRYNYSSEVPVRNIFVKPLAIPVRSETKQGLILNDLTFKESPENPVLIYARFQEPIVDDRFAHLNTSGEILRQSVVRKALDYSPKANLTIGDYLKFEVLYFTTSEMAQWRVIKNTTTAQIDLKNAIDKEMAAIRELPQYAQVMKLQPDVTLEMYIAIYRNNLEDLQRIAHRTAHNKGTDVDYFPNCGDKRELTQEAYYRRQLERQQIDNFLSVAETATAAGATILSEILSGIR